MMAKVSTAAQNLTANATQINNSKVNVTQSTQNITDKENLVQKNKIYLIYIFKICLNILH